MSDLSYSASVTVNAAPEVVYALISDPTRMGESSPVCHKVEWNDGAAGVVGDVFTGFNQVGDREWQTSNEVTIADGASFGWSTGPGVSTWTYTVAAGEDAGTSVLTETWEFPVSGQELLRAKFGEMADAMIAGTATATPAGVDATLAAMKQILETA